MLVPTDSPYRWCEFPVADRPNAIKKWIASEVGAYTRPLLSSTYTVLGSEPLCVHFVTIYDPSIYERYPSYPTKSAYVELESGRM